MLFTLQISNYLEGSSEAQERHLCYFPKIDRHLGSPEIGFWVSKRQVEFMSVYETPGKFEKCIFGFQRYISHWINRAGFANLSYDRRVFSTLTLIERNGENDQIWHVIMCS